MTEKEEAVALARKTLDEPYRDPDDDVSMLSRQFLRALENIEDFRLSLARCVDAIEKRHACISVWEGSEFSSDKCSACRTREETALTPARILLQKFKTVYDGQG